MPNCGIKIPFSSSEEKCCSKDEEEGNRQQIDFNYGNSYYPEEYYYGYGPWNYENYYYSYNQQ